MVMANTNTVAVDNGSNQMRARKLSWGTGWGQKSKVYLSAI